MRNLFIIIITVFLFSCKSVKVINETSMQNNQAYILPDNVTKLLRDNINSDTKNLYFCLYTDSGYYRIYSGYYVDNSYPNIYATKTNRHMLFNGKFYPLIFESDMLFGAIESVDQVNNNYALQSKVLGQRQYTIHDGFYVTFTKDGIVIDSGGVYIHDKGGSRLLEIKRD